MEKETREMFEILKANKEKEQAKEKRQKIMNQVNEELENQEEENLKTKIIIGLSISLVVMSTLLIIMNFKKINDEAENCDKYLERTCNYYEVERYMRGYYNSN